jgi:hypothetical protein
MYGIDSPVRQLANQNAGNPQQLMQSYAQDPSLVKLLALEQLKQDLAAREASITAQLQNNPATILQQREQEVLGGIGGARNTSSVTAQTAGALNQQARQQQQAPQQAPQPGGSPMEQGIASQPATNMQRMASGGIVGFSGEEGSLVEQAQLTGTYNPNARKDDRLELTEADLKSVGYTPEEYKNASLNLRNKIRQTIQDRNTLGSGVGALLRNTGVATSAIADAITQPYEKFADATGISRLANIIGRPEEESAEGSAIAAYGAKLESNNPAGIYKDIFTGSAASTPTTATDADRDALSQAAAAELAASNASQSQAGPGQQPPPAGPSQQPPPAGLASLIQVPPLAKPSLEMQTLAADQLLRQQQAVARDPRAEGTAARDEAAAFQRREEQQKDYAARIAAMDAANAEASDPKKLARERLISFLAGTANTGGLGSWGRGGVRAGQATQTAQRAAQQQRNLELFNAMNTASTADRSISSAAITEGANVRGETEATRLAGETDIGSRIAAGITAAETQQKLATDVAIANQATILGINTANLNATLDKAKIEAQQTTNILTAKGQNLSALISSRDRNVALIAEITANIREESSPTINALSKEAEGESPDSDEAIKYTNALAAREALIAEATKENRKVIADLERRLATGYTGGTLLRP